MKCLPFYKEYFGIGYLLPKLDLIAIQDFVIGKIQHFRFHLLVIDY